MEGSKIHTRKTSTRGATIIRNMHQWTGLHTGQDRRVCVLGLFVVVLLFRCLFICFLARCDVTNTQLVRQLHQSGVHPKCGRAGVCVRRRRAIQKVEFARLIMNVNGQTDRFFLFRQSIFHDHHDAMALTCCYVRSSAFRPVKMLTQLLDLV
jgi:hypothetical protein